MELESWKPVLNWPEYEISDLGNVRSKRGPISLFLVDGYLSFNVCRKGIRKSLRVHREVLRAFVGESEKLCLHKNGIATDCRLENLRWGTHKENEADKILHGSSLRGVRHHQNKLTEADVQYIKNSTERGTDLAKRFGVVDSCICSIRNGRSWKHLCSR